MKYPLAILLALTSFSCYAGLTKWVDEKGVVHYSDRPPSGAKAERVQSINAGNAPPAETPAADAASSSSSPAAASGVAAPKNVYEREADRRKAQAAKDEEDKKAAKKADEARAKEQACQQSRDQLNTLQNAPRVTTYDANGQPTILDDEGRQQRISEAQANIGKFCN